MTDEVVKDEVEDDYIGFDNRLQYLNERVEYLLTQLKHADEENASRRSMIEMLLTLRSNAEREAAELRREVADLKAQISADDAQREFDLTVCKKSRDRAHIELALLREIISENLGGGR